MIDTVSLFVNFVSSSKNGHIPLELFEVGRAASVPAALHAVFPKTM